DDIEEGLPALLTMILMPLTYSITVGIGAGFVMYVLVKIFRGKATEVRPLLWIVAAAFVVFFAQELFGGTAVGCGRRRRPPARGLSPEPRISQRARSASGIVKRPSDVALTESTSPRAEGSICSP